MSRKSEVFDEDVKTFCEVRGLLFLALSRLKGAEGLSQALQNHLADRVYEKTIKYAKKEKVDAIIFFDRLSKKHIDLLRNSEIKAIVDFPACTRKFVQNILQEDAMTSGDNHLLVEQRDSFDEERTSEEEYICKEADGFLVASSFAKRSVVYAGGENDKIFIVPYGVDLDRFH